MSTRIGPRMIDAANYVLRNQGCSMLDVAQYVGPNGSTNYGYRTVHRAIDAGLIVACDSTNGRRKWDLYPGAPLTEVAS